MTVTPQVQITFSLTILALCLSVQMPLHKYHCDLPISLYTLMQSENIFNLNCIDVLSMFGISGNA